MFLAAMFLFNFAYAAGIISGEDSAQFGIAQSLNNLGKFDEAKKILSHLYSKFPEDKAVAFEYAKSLGYSGDLRDAESIFERLIVKYPQDKASKLAFASMLEANQRFPEALVFYEQALGIDPEDAQIRLKLARVLSANRKYSESAHEYDILIKKDPGWELPRREKSRVLGWQRKYEKSIDEYKKIQVEIKSPSKASKLEMAAKNDYYRRFESSGIRAYKAWLENEPDNPEALFDLGQIYSRQMQWDNAKKAYNRIIDIFPSHFMAKKALGKVKLYSSSAKADIGFDHFEASSTSRDMDEAYWDVYSSFAAPLNNEFSLNLREDTYLHSFSTSDFKQATRQRMGAGIEFNKRPYFWGNAFYYYSMYSGNFKDTVNFTEEINLKPADAILFSFLHKKEDVLDNPETLLRNIKKDDYKLRLSVEPVRRFSFGGDYTYSDYSDKNDKFDFGFDAKAQLIYEPKSLILSYRYEEYGFNEPRSYYFSPGNFHFNTVTLEFRHFLNKEELFWGADDIYYTLKYSVNFDVHDQTGHLLYVDLHRDWTDCFSTHLEWSKKIYEHRDVYGEERLMGYVRLYF